MAAPLVNSRRQMTGERLLFPGMKSITIEAPAPPDPFLLPVRSLSSLLQYSPAVASPHRIHVRGRVTLSWPGRTVCIVDETAGLCIQTTDRDVLDEGDLVDVVGFLGRKDYLPAITAATLQPVSAHRRPAAGQRPGVEWVHIASVVGRDCLLRGLAGGAGWQR